MKQFDHEKLNVYQSSIAFVAWTTDLLETVPKSIASHNQLDRASTSIPLNIAEGNGKFTQADRCKYFDNARGSALECAAALDVLVAKRLIESSRATNGKAMLVEIVPFARTTGKRKQDDRRCRFALGVIDECDNVLITLILSEPKNELNQTTPYRRCCISPDLLDNVCPADTPVPRSRTGTSVARKVCWRVDNNFQSCDGSGPAAHGMRWHD